MRQPEAAVRPVQVNGTPQRKGTPQMAVLDGRNPSASRAKVAR